jgi:hypothetical protein
MHTILQYSPGQTATVTVGVTDGYGLLVAPSSAPQILAVYLPNGATAAHFPQTMKLVTTGVYQYMFQLPTGPGSIGSYAVIAQWPLPDTDLMTNELIEIVVNVSFGNFSISPA